LSNFHRRGAALIMAVILIGVLFLLGTPFLLGQRNGVATAKAYARSVRLEQHYASAQALGLDLVTAIMDRQKLTLKNNESPESFVDHLNAELIWLELVDSDQAIRVGEAYTSDDQVHIDVTHLMAQAFPDADIDLSRISIALNDHATRLDANSLRPKEWSELFKAADIGDWDDNAFADSEDTDPSNTNLDDDDGGNVGELAEAIAEAISAPEDHITDLTELLDIIPTESIDFNTYNDLHTTYTAGSSNARFGFRHPLTKPELDRLRPLLTTRSLGWGRWGLMDLGNQSYPATDEDTDDDDAYHLLDAYDRKVYTTINLPKVRVDDQINSYGYANRNLEWTHNRVATSTPAPLNLTNIDEKHALRGSGDLFKTLFGKPWSDTSFEKWLDLIDDSHLSTMPLIDTSPGIIDLTIAANLTTPQGDRLGGQIRQITQQVPPIDSTITHSWDNQAAFEQLVQVRFSNLVTSWPDATRRSGTILGASRNTAEADFAFSPLPFPAPPFTTSDKDDPEDHLKTILESLSLQKATPLGWTVPQGIELTSMQVEHLIQPSIYQEPAADADPDDPARINSNLTEINGFQCQFWLTPNEAWGDQQTILNIQQDQDSTSINPNQLTLIYDNGWFILSLANAILPSAVQTGPQVGPHPTARFGAGDDLDPRTQAGSILLAQGHQYPEQLPAQLAYYYPLEDLDTGESIHVRLGIHDDQAMGLKLTINGILGRSLNHYDPERDTDALSDSQRGDHYAWPAPLFLADSSLDEWDPNLDPAIPQDVTSERKGAFNDLVWPSFEMVLQGLPDDVLTTLGVPNGDKLQPHQWLQDGQTSNQLIQIGGEYLSYQSVDGPDAKGKITLSGCQRLRRKGLFIKDADSKPANYQRIQQLQFPIAPAHPIGSTVYPGGYPNMSLPGWTQKTARLDQDLPAAWTTSTTTANISNTDPPSDHYFLDLSSPSIVLPVEDTTDFPDHGIISVAEYVNSTPPGIHREVAYTAKSNNTLTLYNEDPDHNHSANKAFQTTTNRAELGKEIRLVSVAITDYTPTSFPTSYLQLSTANNDIEWIKVRSSGNAENSRPVIATVNDHHYLMDLKKKQARTNDLDWTIGQTLQPVFHIQPSANTLLPETGDLITLIPNQPNQINTPQPSQIRHVYHHFSDNHYPITNTDPKEYELTATSDFLYSLAPPSSSATPLPSGSITMAAWPGITSMIDSNGVVTYTTLLPPSLGFEPDWGGAKQDPNDPASEPKDERKLTLLDLACTIDHFHYQSPPTNNATAHIADISPGDSLASDENEGIPETILSIDNLTGTTGMVRIHGEVLALEQNNGEDYRVIGRAQLGSQAATIRVGMPVEILSHIPVTRLTHAPLPDGKNGTGDGGRLFLHGNRTLLKSAPTLLLSSASGEILEIIPNIPADGAYVQDGEIKERQDDNTIQGVSHDAVLLLPWLRDLYDARMSNETLVAGAADSSANTLVIGWWPRMPPLLPADNSGIDKHRLISRCYPFASFPVRHYDCRFGIQAIDINSPATTQTAGVRAEFRGLAEFDYNAGKDENDTKRDVRDWGEAPLGLKDNVNNAFGDFHNQITNGAELRVHWRYTDAAISGSNDASNLTALHQLMLRSGLAPTSGPVNITCQVPLLVLDQGTP
jgi:hypothetical protein